MLFNDCSALVVVFKQFFDVWFIFSGPVVDYLDVCLIIYGMGVIGHFFDNVNTE